MRYEELVSFEAIDDIKVLREADERDAAERDVRTFVISDRMRAMLAESVLPHLELDQPTNAKGILVVANYGTGKTHLMSVLSAIAENADLAPLLTNEQTRADVAGVAGRYRVIRAEIGATRMSLRDIVCQELERGLDRLGVEFRFPPSSEVTNTKDSLIEMMSALDAEHGGLGLLFVLDELLDYLRSRKDVELILDLQFLREVGEICRSTRFRFIAGVQEALFDNPRFASASDAVRRVRDRFEQVRISREDIAYVVQERLLRKTQEQRDRIRAHLQEFTPAFEGMAESLDEFVRLFPVHPAYLRTFERITLVEKRRILTALSEAMRRLLPLDVPAEEPGLVCYDSYYDELCGDPSNRSIPEVAEVLNKAQVLRGLVERSLPTEDYRPVALRLVDGLAVHRLTTGDIHVPIGPTIEELRDDLCLLPHGVPERDALFIRTALESVVDEVVRTVSGQFITLNPDNDQIYLDVSKDIDYDQKIRERAISLDNDRLDDAYFRALEEVLEQRDAPYVAGYRIWEYELPWRDRGVTRLGYLFMGAPNERSTAQPPRDFYVYFLQPYDPPSFRDEEKPDEVFFRLASPDDSFTDALRRYAGADALALESTATHRAVYEDKRRTALSEMVAWLRKSMAQAVNVTHKGTSKPLGQWLSSAADGPVKSIKAQVDAIAASELAAHFEARYPGYPTFRVEITRTNLAETARQAISQIASSRQTTLGTRALTALELLDAEGALRDDGPYARVLLEALEGERNRALNRSKLLVERDRGLPTWGPSHLEPLWLVTVAAALCQLGRLELGFPEEQIDAIGLGRLLRKTAEELEELSFVAPPRALPIVELRDAAKLLGVAPGAVPPEGATEGVVLQMLDRAQAMLDDVSFALDEGLRGMQLWGAHVVDREDERAARIEALQRALENIRQRDSVGKMNKLDIGAEALTRASGGKTELEWVKSVIAARGRLADVVEFLRGAEAAFGEGDSLREDAKRLRAEMLELFQSEAPVDPRRVADIRSAAEDLRRRYVEEAARAHARDRLDAPGDDRKRQVLESSSYQDLKRLSRVPLLPQTAFAVIERALLDIRSCNTFDEASLQSSVRCPECGYEPRPGSGPTARARVDELESQVVRLRADWQRTLAENLEAPELKQKFELIAPSDRGRLEQFVASGKLPDPVDDGFVRALTHVFDRFEVHRINAKEIWKALFPVPGPATIEDLEERFRGYLDGLRNGAPAEQVRIVPATDDL